MTSTYLRMWEHVRTMDEASCRAFIEEHAPATGKDILLPNGTLVLDADVLQAVRNHHVSTHDELLGRLFRRMLEKHEEGDFYISQRGKSICVDGWIDLSLEEQEVLDRVKQES